MYFSSYIRATYVTPAGLSPASGCLPLVVAGAGLTPAGLTNNRSSMVKTIA